MFQRGWIHKQVVQLYNPGHNSGMSFLLLFGNPIWQWKYVEIPMNKFWINDHKLTDHAFLTDPTVLVKPVQVPQYEEEKLGHELGVGTASFRVAWTRKKGVYKGERRLKKDKRGQVQLSIYSSLVTHIQLAMGKLLKTGNVWANPHEELPQQWRSWKQQHAGITDRNVAFTERNMANKQ